MGEEHPLILGAVALARGRSPYLSTLFRVPAFLRYHSRAELGFLSTIASTALPERECRMPFSLSGKTAIVTGGASGIGLAIAEAFGAAGADVHILDLAAPAISTAVEGCRRKGLKCTGHVCDVTVASRVNACFDAICADGRRCDVLVNNAGIGAVGTVEQATDAEMDRWVGRRPWAGRP